MIDLNRKTERNSFTRRCIAEAIIDLMQREDFYHIKISHVAKRAGVSRKTFYNYYDSIYSALTDYLQEIISEYLNESHATPQSGHFLEYEHILFSLRFFDRYAFFFLTLTKQGLHALLLDGINQFMLEHFSKRKNHSVFEMYCYAGGLLNCFLKWEESHKIESVEEITDILYQLYN